MPKKKRKSYFVQVDIYVHAEDSDHAQHIVARKLDRVASKRQQEPYIITYAGICDDQEDK